MRESTKSVILASVAASLWLGCPTNTTTADGGPQSGGGQAGGSVAAGGSAGGTAGGSAGGTAAAGGVAVDAGAPGTSCATAVPLTFGFAVSAEITPAARRRFYSLPVDAGEFVWSFTNTNAGGVNTAMTLFDSTGRTIIASNDDLYPASDTSDSDITYRSPNQAELCLAIEDSDSWSGGSGNVPPNNTFQLRAFKLTPTFQLARFFAADNEPNDTDGGRRITFAATTNPAPNITLDGVLDSATDVDEVSILIPSEVVELRVSVPPNGSPPVPARSTGGSTLVRFVVTVRAPDGSVVAQLAPPPAEPDGGGGPETMSQELRVPVVAGERYVVSISRPAGAAVGANDFYVSTLQAFKPVFAFPNENEVRGANSNDTPETAEAVSFQPSRTNPKRKFGYLRGYLPAGDRADYVRVPLGRSDSLGVYCQAARWGSGLIDFNVRLEAGPQPDGGFIDAGVLADGGVNVVLQSDTEVLTRDLWWAEPRPATQNQTAPSNPPVEVSTAGTYYLRFSAASRSATNTGDTYVCNIIVASP